MNNPNDPIQYTDVYGLCFNNISNAIVSGICNDIVSVPISEEVRKQPHNHKATASNVQMKPFRKSKANCPWLGSSNVSILVKCNIKKMGHNSSRFHRPTKPAKQNNKSLLTHLYERLTKEEGYVDLLLGVTFSLHKH